MNEYVYKQLVSLLQQAADLCIEHAGEVENFDLDELAQSLENNVRELDDVGAFVSKDIYRDEDEDDKEY